MLAAASPARVMVGSFVALGIGLASVATGARAPTPVRCEPETFAEMADQLSKMIAAHGALPESGGCRVVSYNIVRQTA